MMDLAHVIPRTREEDLMTHFGRQLRRGCFRIRTGPSEPLR
jgi:hypothetical protein